MASFLDARSHDGTWLIRIEDIDTERCRSEYAKSILSTLSQFGLVSDEPVIYQSERNEFYEVAFKKLQAMELIYGCACTRKDIEEADKRLTLPHGMYPGTCRNGTAGKPIRSWRFRVPEGAISFKDRLKGIYTQDVSRTTGDFILRRSDGLWAYQLAVVLDDAAQHVTDVVRGEDLLDNTPRQILLQNALNLPTPRYLHIPLVCRKDGKKLSKQNHAQAVSVENPLALLELLLGHFGLPPTGEKTLKDFWKSAVKIWQENLPE